MIELLESRFTVKQERVEVTSAGRRYSKRFRRFTVKRSAVDTRRDFGASP
jgi:hypothetical protein